jgi:glyoxylase-like metal-dependent hydrolase (beta-lactamase superfamily II)
VRLERHPVGPLENNLYLLVADSGRDAIVVDPSMDSEAVLQDILARGLSVRKILLTHAHFDHVLMTRRFHDATGAPVWLHPEDRFWWDRAEKQATTWGFAWDGAPPVAHWMEDGEDVGVPGIEVKAVHTPGHSPGSMTFVTGEGLIVGDVLFAGSVGRTDFPMSDWDTLVASVREVLFGYDDDTRVCPGHGPETTIGHERRTNPFVGDRAAGMEG